MSTILVIEDNANIRIEVSDFFRQNGYETICPQTFENVEMLADKAQAVLLDINLGNADGFHICRKIRKSSDVPVLFVTGRNSEEDELRAMALGGDDYIRKPYSLPVLLAKVKRMIERSSGNSPDELKAGDVSLNVALSRLKFGDKTLELPKNENKILYYLFLNKGRTVSKSELIEYLWDNRLYVDENILNVNLSRLRKHLADLGLTNFILTVPKEGYRINSNY